AKVTQPSCPASPGPANGTTYRASGVYDNITTGTDGCQDTLRLTLTINNGTRTNVTQTACAAYTWPANGTTYRASGVYDNITTGTDGCQDTLRLTLTINNGTRTNVTQAACAAYTWPANGTTYRASGGYDSTDD